MTDLSLTVEPKSSQLNADDMLGGPRIIEITGVSGRDNAEQPIAINFKGDNGKPYYPCKTMRRALIHIWGKDGTQYPGRSLTLYCDPEVAFGGLKVGGIRISHASHINKAMTMALTATRGQKKPFTIKPLAADASPPPPTVDRAAALATMQAAAAKGTASLQAAWEAAEPAVRTALKADLDALKAQAAQVDQQMSDDAPFEEPAQQEQAGGEDYTGV